MRLDWIRLAGFRSYAEVEWRPDAAVNVLVGNNGAGKTNLLEAVSYLATLRSFRSAPDEALIAYDATEAVIRAEIEGSEDRRSLIEVEIGRGKSRRVQVNRNRLMRTAELLHHLQVVTFLPEDLDIVKRGPALRRDFLDDLAVAATPAASLDRAEFERALRQRNAFLRQGIDDAVTLSVWDERLALAAGRVMSRRAQVAQAMSDRLGEAYRFLAGEESELAWEYRSEWGGSLDATVGAGSFTERLAESLARRRRADIERRVTGTGPHRDDPALLLDGHDLRYHGSQGEQRSTALALRLASHGLVEERTGFPPVLILDDVFSELDPDRSAALASALPHGQTIISTAERSDVPVEGVVWSVEASTVQRASQGGGF